MRCELCDLELDQCVHGMAKRKRETFQNPVVRVSPNNVAHLPGCSHEESAYEDFAGWGEIGDSGAWIYLCQTMPLDARKVGYVSDLRTTSGKVVGLEIRHVCLDCRSR